MIKAIQKSLENCLKIAKNGTKLIQNDHRGRNGSNAAQTVFQQCSNSVLTPVSARCWHVLTPVSAQVLEQISGDSHANVGTQTLDCWTSRARLTKPSGRA